jgi:hypothetical protein
MSLSLVVLYDILLLTQLLLSCVLFILYTIMQAIDKLEAMLNGGLRAGQTNMFGPREYVAIYT